MPRDTSVVLEVRCPHCGRPTDIEFEPPGRLLNGCEWCKRATWELQNAALEAWIGGQEEYGGFDGNA